MRRRLFSLLTLVSKAMQVPLINKMEGVHPRLTLKAFAKVARQCAGHARNNLPFCGESESRADLGNFR